MVHYICIDRVSVKRAPFNSLSYFHGSDPPLDIYDTYHIRYTIYDIYNRSTILMTPYNMSFPVFVFVLPHVFVIVFVFPIFTMTSMHFPKLRHCPTQNFKLLKLETSICSKRGWGESFFPFNMCSKIILFNTALNPGVPWQYFSCFFNATLMLWVFSWLDPILGFRQYHCGPSWLLLPMQFGLSLTPG